MDSSYFAGIDIGGTKISTLITDGEGKILGRAKKKSRSQKRQESVLERATSCCQEACEDAGIKIETLKAIGVGAPSPILPDGTAVEATNLGWKDVPITKILSDALRRPVYAENDCNVGTFGEYALGGHGNSKLIIGLFMGTGLGGGIVKDGKILVGENSMASEVGHMTIQPGGRPCGCGKIGCLEAYASKKGMAYGFKEGIVFQGKPSVLTELVEDGSYENIRSSILKKAWNAGDDVAQTTLREAATYLGIGVGNLITLLGPSVIVIGGGVFDALGEELMPILLGAAQEHTFPSRSYKDTRIELASLGDDAVALGAMAYARARHG
jgi:glucokinase